MSCLAAVRDRVLEHASVKYEKAIHIILKKNQSVLRHIDVSVSRFL